MRIAPSVACALLCVLMTTAARAAVRTGPDPAWVRAMPVPDSVTVPLDRTRGGAYPLLYDFQYNRAVHPAETWYHTAIRVVNEEGVTAASRVMCEFDPAVHQLCFHRVVIRRGGQLLDRLDARKFELIQRETGLEESVYHGSRTALLLLDDVRPGDVVEVAFSLRGENPVLGGHFETLWWTAWDGPFALQSHRLLWPSDRPLAIRPLRSQATPAIRRGGAVTEYMWLVANATAVETDRHVPFWYDEWPAIELSDCTSWNEVARWGAALYRTGAPGPALRARIDELRASSGDSVRRALAAIRFVQDGVRYLGIEPGESSHRPTAPDLVYARRFGDCKDKALLLLTLLRGLGFDAHVAFVSARRQDDIRAWAPAVMAFDHAIVCFRHAGAPHWVDATQQAVRAASLDDLDVPDFGPALVLDDTTTVLSTVRAPDGAAPVTRITREFDARKVNGPATLTVRTRYLGRTANRIRAQLRGDDVHELSRGYVRFYARTYPRIEPLAEPAVADDEDGNAVEIVERYRIPGFWETAEGSGRRFARFDAAEVGELPDDAGGTRTTPFSLGARQHLVIETHAVMPPGWSAATESVSVEQGPVRFHVVVHGDHGALWLTHDLEVLESDVPAGDAADVASAFSDIEGLTSFTTYPGRNRAAPSHRRGPQLPAIAAMLVGVATGVFTAWRFAWGRRAATQGARDGNPSPADPGHAEDAAPPPVGAATGGVGVAPFGDAAPDPLADAGATDEAVAGHVAVAAAPSSEAPADAGDASIAVADATPAGTGEAAADAGDASIAVADAAPAGTDEPNPIGGWLILLAIGVTANPWMRLLSARPIWRLMREDHWYRSTHIEHHGPTAALVTLLLMELAVNALLVVWSFALLVLFFRTRREFPKAWTVLTATGIAFLAVDLVGASLVLGWDSGSASTVGRLMRDTVTLAIWATYLAHSPRARRTFVR